MRRLAPRRGSRRPPAWLAAMPATAARGADSARRPYVVVLRDAAGDADARASRHSRRATASRAKLPYSDGLERLRRPASPPPRPRGWAPTASSRTCNRTYRSTATGLSPLATGETSPAGMRRIGAATTTGARRGRRRGRRARHGRRRSRTRTSSRARHRTASRPGPRPRTTTATARTSRARSAARNGAGPIVGVAPGTRIYPVKILNNKGEGTLSQVAVRHQLGDTQRRGAEHQGREHEHRRRRRERQQLRRRRTGTPSTRRSASRSRRA